MPPDESDFPGGIPAFGITVPDVTKCLARLKHEKSDELRGTTSDHIHCSHQFKVYIAILVNAMFVHGYTPSGHTG